MILQHVMKICSGILVLVLPIMSSELGYRHGVRFDDSLLEEKALCMSKCLDIRNDEWKRKCEAICDGGKQRQTELPMCPIGQFYDPDFQECEDCDSICLYTDTQHLCDAYCPDYAADDYDDDDYNYDEYDDENDDDEYDDDDYDDDDYDYEEYDDVEDAIGSKDYASDDYDDVDSEEEFNLGKGDTDYASHDYDDVDSEEEFNPEIQREDTDYDVDDYDYVDSAEEDTLKPETTDYSSEEYDSIEEEEVNDDNQVKTTGGKQRPIALPMCPVGQFYDPDFQECDDCDSICLYTDTQHLCDAYCPDWKSEDYEDVGSAELGSGTLDDDLETSDLDHDALLSENITETTDDASSEIWFSDNDVNSSKLNTTNSSRPDGVPTYSEQRSGQDHKTEAPPSKLLYCGLFVAGAFVAFIITILALTLWKPFRYNIKHLLSGKKDTSSSLLPYRSPIVRRGPATFTTERESFL